MGPCVLRVAPNVSTLDAPEEILHLVGEALTVTDPAAQYTTAYRFGRYDGRVRFLKRPGNRFPTGLVARVMAVVEAAGGHVEVRPDSPAPPSPPPLAAPLTVAWRPYQIEAVERIFREGRVIVQAPTASGKTLIGVEVARRHGGPTLWVVHTRALLAQTLAVLRTHLPAVDIAQIGGGVCEVGTITVGIVASLANLVGEAFWPHFTCLIEDEAHHGGAETWLAVANACTQAALRVGLSGTAINVTHPVRRMRMEGALGPVVVLTDSMTLAESGFLARPRIRFLRPPADSYPSYEAVREGVLPSWRADPRPLGRMGGRLHAAAYDGGIVANQARNRLILQTAHRHVRRHERVLVLCRLVAHARHLAQRYTAQAPGVPCWQLDGTASLVQIAPVLDSFRAARQGALLIATPFFREGVDLPEIDVYINAAGGQSEVATLQALGRALRPRADKADAAVYDFLDGGAPTHRPEKDYLALHSQERLRTYHEQHFDIEEPPLK